jgi:HEPN domain-containing protein
MNRDDFRNLARIRRKEARVLLENENYDGAYYISGYVVECALKACIARKTKRYDFPDKEAVNKSYTHDLGQLVRQAGLEPQLGQQTEKDSLFAVNWAVVKDWSEGSRYERHDRRKAGDLYSAITNRQHGVLRWLRRHW